MNARTPPPPYEAPEEDVHVRAPKLFPIPDLEAEGRARAQGLFPDAPTNVVEGHRTRLREHARMLVYGRIPDMPPVSDAEVGLYASEFQHLHDVAIPQARHEERVRERDLENVSAQLSQLGEPPAEPARAGFFVMAVLLGIVFGLFASTTLSAFLSAVLGIDPEGGRMLLVEGGVAIGILVGVVVSLPVVVLGRYALGGQNWAIRHGPVALGACLAIGLGGFRLLHTDPDTGAVSVSVSSIGVALLFVELAVLCGVEFVNQVYLNAWRQYEEGSREHKRLERMREQEKKEFETDMKERVDLEKELEDVRASLQRANGLLHEWRRDHANRDAFVDLVATHLLNGFELALNERRLGTA